MQQIEDYDIPKPMNKQAVKNAYVMGGKPIYFNLLFDIMISLHNLPQIPTFSEPDLSQFHTFSNSSTWSGNQLLSSYKLI